MGHRASVHYDFLASYQRGQHRGRLLGTRLVGQTTRTTRFGLALLRYRSGACGVCVCVAPEPNQSILLQMSKIESESGLGSELVELIKRLILSTTERICFKDGVDDFRFLVFWTGVDEFRSIL